MKGEITMPQPNSDPNVTPITNNNPAPSNGGGSGEPNPQNGVVDVEAEVSKRLASKEEELRKQILKEIEEEKNLSDAQKLELERQKFAEEKLKWQKQVEEQTLALNVDKVKGIYVKAGLSNELVDLLATKVGLDYSVAESEANKVAKAINDFVEQKTKELKETVQKQQPSLQIKPENQDNNLSYFEKFNIQSETKSNYFK
jgi:hypothetical protein